MKKKALTDEQVLAKRFPTRAAWPAADKAADALSPRASMSAHIDVWIAAYMKAGGRRTEYED